MKAASLLALAGCGVLSGCASPRVLNVTPSGQGTAAAPCVAVVEGRRIPLDAFPAFARRWRGREAHLAGGAGTPYRCFGRIIYELQRAGFQRIGFISEPAAASDTHP